MSKKLIAAFDVSDLNDKEIAVLGGYVTAQGEGADRVGLTDDSDDVGYPSVKVTTEVIDEDDRDVAEAEEIAEYVEKWLRRRIAAGEKSFAEFAAMVAEDPVDAMVHATSWVVAAGKQRAYLEAIEFFDKSPTTKFYAMTAAARRVAATLNNRARSVTYNENASTGAIADRATIAALAEIVDYIEGETK